MDERERKLEALGYPLDRTNKPGAIYEPLRVDGTTVYAAGAVPFDGDKLVSKGKVPSQVSVEEARNAAALCAANILRIVRRELGSLDCIDYILRLAGYVNSDSDFTDQHLVVNGASQLLIDVLGDAGRHARLAVGMAQLPIGACVEIELILRLKEKP
jgi:enamine deaminase RidA (YjgF/YER057c/UK114 family)